MGGEGAGKSPEELAREHEKIRREIEQRGRTTEGGLSQADIDRVTRQQIAADVPRAKRERVERADERVRQLKGSPPPEPAESILDEIDDDQASTGVMGLAPEATPAPSGGRSLADMWEARRAGAGWLAALRRPGNQMRLVMAGLGAVGLIFVFFFLRQQLRNEAIQVPDVDVGSPNSLPTSTTGVQPISEVPPAVTGTATAAVSFTRLSGTCNFAAQFTDIFEFEVTIGVLVLTQLSNGHETRGTMTADGEFTTTADDQNYHGQVSGTTAAGEHTYTAEGCNEVYAFTMELSEALVPATTP